MPREGHGSRNQLHAKIVCIDLVMPREGHGSRNYQYRDALAQGGRVMPREGHGSRNFVLFYFVETSVLSCPARGMGVEIAR